jgi:class 3 adenylate cyclase
LKHIFTSIQRRRIWVGFRIVVLTCVAVLAQTAGWLTRLEDVLDDERAALCQHFAPRPTPALVHLDIDETAISQVGRWPWHRDVMAEILDEVHLTAPKVLAMDILFAEPEEAVYDKRGREIDRDRILTDTIRRSDQILVPCSFTFDTPPKPDVLMRKITAQLEANLQTSYEECVRRLAADGLKSPALQDRARESFLIARPLVMYQKIHDELAAKENKPLPQSATAGINDEQIAACPSVPKQIVKQALFPHAGEQFAGSVLDRLFDEEYDKAVRERALYRFTLPIPPGASNVLAADAEITPILCMSSAAKFSAFVDYLPDHEDGTVRRVPMLASFRGRLVPHMGLATACALLGVDIHSLRIGPNSITIPRPGEADIVIPTSTVNRAGVGPVGYLLEVPMFGKPGKWTTMYDFPRHEKPAQHVSVYEVWRICQTRRRMAANESAADVVLVRAMGLTDPVAAKMYQDSPFTGEAKDRLIQSTRSVMGKMVAGMLKDGVDDDDSRQLLTSLQRCAAELDEIGKQNSALGQQLADLRCDLRSKLSGKAIFLGGTATGNVDVVPTSLFAQCPGVVVHGAIVNAILTGKMYRVAPAWVTVFITGAMALFIGILASTLSPSRAFVATIVFAGGYLVVNGFVLFDHGSLIVGAAGPLVAAILAWSMITLFNFIAEAAERTRITRRFSSYVDPSLVNYVIKHPDQIRFTGERREMTMGFTDLAGFTTLTESLGPRTVPLLSEYMNLMIPTIRRHQGYVSRLMGDGIYFFFGAPEEDERHASHAVSTVLAMHQAMDELNRTLPARGFPTLTMRAGLCSGKVIVGDAGSNEFHDYTAVGDSVNTAARLESANKVFGTKALVGARTIELLNGQYLSRPIANVRVAGKTKGVLVYEPLCRVEAADDATRRLAELSVQLVGTFQCANFADCIVAADRLEKEFGPGKFAELYRKLAVEHQVNLPDDFDGQVVLTEK